MRQLSFIYSRLLFPTIISVIIGTFYYLSVTNQSFYDIRLNEYFIPILIAMAFGAFFYLTNIQLWVTRFSQKRFALLIKIQIIELYARNLSKTQRRYLYNSNTLKKVVNNIIENSESLKKKAVHGFFIGPFWASVSGLLIVCFLFSIIYFASTIVFREAYDQLIIGGLTMALIATLAFVTHVLAFFMCSRLSKKQIAQIKIDLNN